MFIENIELNELYQHKLTKRLGRAVLKDQANDTIVLQDIHGDNFRVPCFYLKHNEERFDDNFWIDLDDHDKRNTATLFLCKQLSPEDHRQPEFTEEGQVTFFDFVWIGSAKYDTKENVWIVSLEDEENASEKIIKKVKKREQAIDILWNSRN